MGQIAYVDQSLTFSFWVGVPHPVGRAIQVLNVLRRTPQSGAAQGSQRSRGPALKGTSSLGDQRGEWGVYARQMALLPLFPLGTVLMPGQMLPLQIFERRYVDLLQDLIAAQDTRPPVFGVVAIRKGFEVGEDGARALHPVGCSAQVRQATALGEERFLIVIQGRSRFRLDGLVAESGTSYAQAEVSWLHEPEGDEAEIGTLAAQLRSEVSDYRAAVGEEELSAPEDDRELAYWLPQALDLALGDQQLLLMSESTRTRLRLARQIVRRERTLNSSLGTTGGSFGGPMSPN